MYVHIRTYIFSIVIRTYMCVLVHVCMYVHMYCKYVSIIWVLLLAKVCEQH